MRAPLFNSFYVLGFFGLLIAGKIDGGGGGGTLAFSSRSKLLASWLYTPLEIQGH